MKVLQICGDDWKLWALLALAYNKMNMPEEAEDAGQRLMNLYPGYEPVYPELMNALLAMGRNEEAYNVMRFGKRNRVLPSSSLRRLRARISLLLETRTLGEPRAV